MISPWSIRIEYKSLPRAFLWFFFFFLGIREFLISTFQRLRTDIVYYHVQEILIALKLRNMYQGFGVIH